MVGNISANATFEYFPYEVQEQEDFTIDIIKEISPNSMDWEIIKELSLLDINDDVLYRQFYTLSKGEQTKALLAAMFLKENSFLLIDEPTNHLDAEARKKLSNYLRKKKGFISILRKFDFSREQFEKNIEDFSGGQKKKVLIAKSLCEQAHLYIWDEPLNFIDVISRMQVEKLLIEYQPTILFVEHDCAFCENVATKAIRL